MYTKETFNSLYKKALVASKDNNIDKAVYYFKETAKIALKEECLFIASRITMKVGQLYAQQENYNLSHKAYKQAQGLCLAKAGEENLLYKYISRIVKNEKAGKPCL